MKKLLTLLCLAGAFATPPVLADPKPILIGQSASLTGGQAAYGRDVRDGIEAAIAAANAKGGIRGRPIQLVTLDDAGKREGVLANTKTLVEQHHVAALVGYTSGAGVEATLPYLSDAGVPLIGPATGNMGIRDGFHRFLFHVRAGYSDEMNKVVKHLVTTNLKRFAIVYLDDVGPANPQSMVNALQQNGLQPVASAAINRNADKFDKEAERLLKGEPEVVLAISNAKPVIKLVQAMKAKGYTGQYAIASFAGLSMIDELKQDSRGLILSQVLPPPSAKHHVRLIGTYQADMGAHKPQAVLNYTSLEGYIAARVLIEGLKRSAGDGGAKLVAGLESMERVDLGGYEISFSPHSHHGSRFVNPGIVNAAGHLVF